MWNWFLTSWNESDRFKISVCLAIAVVATFAFSDRRKDILRPFINFFAWVFQLRPPKATKRRTKAATKTKLATVDTKPPTQQELTDWISEVRSGCSVSFVEEVDGHQFVHQGTVGAIVNDLAWIVWNSEVTDHPFTGGLGPDGQTESEHNIELIMKQHELGDRGVTWDPSGIVLVSSGWSVFSWPKFDRSQLEAQSNS